MSDNLSENNPILNAEKLSSPRRLSTKQRVTLLVTLTMAGLINAACGGERNMQPSGAEPKPEDGHTEVITAADILKTPPENWPIVGESIEVQQGDNSWTIAKNAYFKIYGDLKGTGYDMKLALKFFVIMNNIQHPEFNPKGAPLQPGMVLVVPGLPGLNTDGVPRSNPEPLLAPVSPGEVAQPQQTPTLAAGAEAQAPTQHQVTPEPNGN